MKREGLFYFGPIADGEMFSGHLDFDPQIKFVGVVFGRVGDVTPG